MCTSLLGIVADSDVFEHSVVFIYFSPYTEHDAPLKQLMIIQYIG